MRYSLNGTLYRKQSTAIRADDRGFTLGDGVFETMRVQNGQVPLLARHLDRLTDSLARLDIMDAPNSGTLAHWVAELLTANALDQGTVRLSVSRGPGGRATDPTGAGPAQVLITASDKPAPTTPLTLAISQDVRRNERSPAAGIKSLSYLDNVLARQEAVRRGADEAVLLNTRDRVAETTIANIVVLTEGGPVTPPLTDGCLPGIARAILLETGMIDVRSLTQEDLTSAEAICITNAVTIRPVAKLDDQSLQVSKGQNLAQRFRDAAGL